MPTPTFTTPPPAPSTSDPSTFDARADAHLAWMATNVTEMTTGVTWMNATAVQVAADAGTASTAATTATTQANTATAQAVIAAAAAATAVAAPGTQGTSTSSVAIGYGTKSFITQTGKSFPLGGIVTIAASASPSVNRMDMVTTAYNSGTGQLDGIAINKRGSGTIASWTISISGAPGVKDFDQDTSATSNLNLALFGGNFRIDNVSTAIANSTVALTASQTNYVEVSASGFSANTTGFTTGRYPLYTAVTGVSSITSVTDNRGDAVGVTSVNVMGGATETTSAVDIALTSGSNRAQSVAMTVAGKIVSLPDATTITTLKGSPVYVVTNSGTLVFPVRDFTGNTLAILGSGQSASFTLHNTSTTSGTWKVHNQTYDCSPLNPFNNGSMVAISASAIGNAIGRITCAPISATKVLLCWVDQGATLSRCAVVDISGSTPTIGTPATFFSGGATFISVCVISATQAIVCYQDGGSTGGQAKVINFSGSTIGTIGSAFNYSASTNTNANSVQPLTATTAIVLYNDTSNNLNAKILTVSTNTITGGSAGSIQAATATTYQTVIVLSATKAVGLYQLNSSGFLRAVVLDISGTTITPGGDVALNAVASTEVVGAATVGDGNRLLVAYVAAGANGQAFSLTVSGTTFNAGPVLTFKAGAISGFNMTTINGRRAALAYATASSTAIETAIISATQGENTVTAIASNALNATGSLNAACAVTSTGKMFTAYRNTSTTFGNTVVTEILG